MVLQTEILKGMDKVMFHLIKTEETDKDGDADREIFAERGATQTRVKERQKEKSPRRGMGMMGCNDEDKWREEEKGKELQWCPLILT